MKLAEKIPDYAFYLVFAAATIIILSESLRQPPVLKQLQFVAGIYLALLPTGLLFLFALFPKPESMGLAERLLLGIALSIPLNTFGLLVSNTVFGFPLNLKTAIITEISLSALLFAAFKLREAVIFVAKRQLASLERRVAKR
jgi:uncharacterized membrane protein